jgi:hypothetical protein
VVSHLDGDTDCLRKEKDGVSAGVSVKTLMNDEFKAFSESPAFNAEHYAVILRVLFKKTETC